MWILFIYFLILFFPVFLSRRKSHTEKGFYLGGEDIGCLVLTFSLLATILGASSTMGLVGLSYRIGLPGSLWLITGALGLFLLSSIYRKYPFSRRFFTLPQFLGEIYGDNVQKVTSIIISISWIGIISAQILALAKIFTIFFPNFNSGNILFISAVVLISYTALGGQLTVILTDFLQFILLSSGIVALNFILLFKTGFDLSFISSQYLRFPVNDYFRFQDFFYFLLVLGSVYLIGPDIHSRLFCTRDIKARRKTLVITAFLLIPLGLLISLIGMLAHSCFSKDLGEEILPLLIKKFFDKSLISHLFLLSLISALFSSSDTCLLTLATIITRDILNIRDKKSPYFAQILIVVIGIISYLVSIYFKKIIHVLLVSYSIYTSGCLLPFVLIPFKEKFKIKNQAVFLSIIIAGSLALIANIFNSKSWVLVSYLLGGIVIFLFSIFRRQDRP